MPREKIEPELIEHSGQGRVKIELLPANKSISVPPGVSVFDAASWNGIAIDSTCGGHGTCKKCKVKITEGRVPISRLDIRAFSEKELNEGWRLACVSRAVEDLKIEVPPLSTRPKAATVGVGRQVILRPSIQKRFLKLSEPSLEDQRTDLQRIMDEINDIDLKTDLFVLRKIPRILRSSNFEITAVIADEELIDIEPGDTTNYKYGVAYDLGTTTVVATLMDLNTGTPVSVKSMLNKQQPFGADVISRISATMLDKNSLEKLSELAKDTLIELTEQVILDSKIEKNYIYEIAIAGNATMIQLVLNIDPEPIGVAPFITVSKDFPELKATDFGILINENAKAYVFPSFGAYVGGDIVSGVLASGIDRDKRVRLFIDVGTNCEIVITDGENILATAAPAGPAFEAASIKCGMRAAEGAIEVVKINENELTIQTIGEVEPVGICGSGLVDAVAELARVGIIDKSGKFVDEKSYIGNHAKLFKRFVTTSSGEKIFVLHGSNEDPIVYLSQRDVRELQFAKASIATGWSLLIEELKINSSEIQQVLLAGSFGSYLSPSSAINIGLVPKLPVLRIVSAGNVAGEGAKMVLLSSNERKGVQTLLDEVKYIELSDRTDFNDKFVTNLAFPN
jgi:uncharacterized 2Fe-2S/4Fe-4S cluster protein (DUF4445 family)